VDVLVARRPLAAGHRIARRDLAVRRVPARFVPAGPPPVAEAILGERLAVGVEQGGAIGPLLLKRPPPVAAVGKDQRAAEVVAAAAPGTVMPGARVDVLVTRERGGTELALQDVEVLAAGPARAEGQQDGGSRVAATLRVSLRQAVYLAAAGASAREIRLLARAPGDDRRIAPVSMDAR
jgi:pilus assembly protein CpaB